MGRKSKNRGQLAIGSEEKDKPLQASRLPFCAKSYASLFNHPLQMDVLEIARGTISASNPHPYETKHPTCRNKVEVLRIS